MAVPAHTRDDTHISGDSLEIYVKNNLNKIEPNLNLSTIAVFNLDQAFTDLAKFCNQNFFSNDTIDNSRYDRPYLDKNKIVNGYLPAKIDNHEYKLALVRQSIFDKNFIIYSLDDQVLSDYADLLVAKAVIYQEAIIELFLKAVSENFSYDLSGTSISWRGYVDGFFGFLVSEAKKTAQTIWALVYQPVKGDDYSVISQNNLVSQPAVITVNSEKLANNDDLIENNQQKIILVDLESNLNLPNKTIVQTDDNGSNSFASNLSAPIGEYASTAEQADIIIEAEQPARPAKEQVQNSVAPNNNNAQSNQDNSGFNSEVLTNDTTSDFATGSAVISVLATSSVLLTTTSTIFSTSSTEWLILSAPTIQLSASSTNIKINISLENILSILVGFDLDYSTDGLNWRSKARATTTFAFSHNGRAGLTYYWRARTVNLFNNNYSDWSEPSKIYLTESRDVIINEIAWAGTYFDFPQDQWLELYNNTDRPIDMNKWQLNIDEQIIDFSEFDSAIIKPYNYFLLERGDDEVVKEISADIVYGQEIYLPAQGAKIKLLNGRNEIIDMVQADKGWWAGGENQNQTMERLNTRKNGSDSDNWQTNRGFRAIGRTRLGAPIYGSPKMSNFGFVALNYDQKEETRILSVADNPYVLQYYQVGADKKLVVEPGVVIKSYYNNSYLQVSGELVVGGSATSSVIWTSGRDQNFSSDILNKKIGAWDANEPQAKDWQGIWLKPGSSAVLNNLDMRYAGHEFRLANYLPIDTSQFIRAEQSDLKINSSSFSYGADCFLYSQNSTTTVSQSKFSRALSAIETKDSRLILDNNYFDLLASGAPISIRGDWPKLSRLNFSVSTTPKISFGPTILSAGVFELGTDWQYSFSSLHVLPNAVLIIKPGAIIDFDSYGYARIDGELRAEGQADQIIKIGNRKDWGYISFNNSTSSLKYVEIYGGGIIVGEHDSAIAVNNSNLTVENSRLWNARAPGNIIRSNDSTINMTNNILGMDKKWTDPLWPGMSYSTGLMASGGNLKFNNISFINLNYAIYKKAGSNGQPLISLENMDDDNYINVYRKIAW
ncbi:MAG: hypothetical protein COU31_00410 [Candidatus Magasanikbacteria bacterium CG10_big_fil_rev_8_21_14_0_10_40_10]|uniref:LTD domain-containing protein n=1 Tax=Candidatus Magasanikbacteria bacterium CG10_big_fil_rev_8_21_14_0_10_40_10 TaxID=1974648 RepID=A0A2M6W577_9BACT|nr:MAG: hypothetical protein COU31_00410 [Candidatus Magasanikbacteria bacterium CG10_big_fil_rev_8_21_14_0_10_40_10]